jgi:hypothetical protein
MSIRNSRNINASGSTFNQVEQDQFNFNLSLQVTQSHGTYYAKQLQSFILT